MPRNALEVIHANKPTVADYRFLYNAVGRDYHWYSRGQLSDTEPGGILSNPLNEIHVLHVEGETAGFAEVDRRVEEEIELVQFGLMPEFPGQGLGKWFLQWTIDKAWSYQPGRFWLHTCALDHPAALPNYLKAGFTVSKKEHPAGDLMLGFSSPPFGRGSRFTRFQTRQNSDTDRTNGDS